MIVLDPDDWTARAEAHAARVDAFVAPHLARRASSVKHPVHDFLFTYYSQRPAQLRRWHPGYGVALRDAAAYDGLKGYVATGFETGVARPPQPPVVEEGLLRPSPPPVVEEGALRLSRNPATATVTVSDEYVAAQRPLLTTLHRLLTATASRPANLGCFGLHEWAMVYRADETRHDWPLRLGAAGTDTVVESHRIGCSHFDAYRFFTPPAAPLNALSPTASDRPDFEQPGCLHAGMDLYKHAFRLSPMICSDLVADCFELARDIRVMDMRAAPYDLSGLELAPGVEWTPIPIETPDGKREYADAQRGFAERGAPLRARLIAECERLLDAGQSTFV